MIGAIDLHHTENNSFLNEHIVSMAWVHGLRADNYAKYVYYNKIDTFYAVQNVYAFLTCENNENNVDYNFAAIRIMERKKWPEFRAKVLRNVSVHCMCTILYYCCHHKLYTK